MIFGVATDIFDANRHFEKIARGADLFGGVTRCGKSVRHGQQIMRITPVDAAPAKMVGKPRRVCAFHQSFETSSNAHGPICRPSRNTSPRRAGLPGTVRELVKHLEWPAPIDHEILGDDLKPIDDRLFGENVPVMWHTQTETNFVVGKTVIRACRHL